MYPGTRRRQRQPGAASHLRSCWCCSCASCCSAPAHSAPRAPALRMAHSSACCAPLPWAALIVTMGMLHCNFIALRVMLGLCGSDRPMPLKAG